MADILYPPPSYTVGPEYRANRLRENPQLTPADLDREIRLQEERDAQARRHTNARRLAWNLGGLLVSLPIFMVHWRWAREKGDRRPPGAAKGEG